MATQDVKTFLSTITGIAEANLKRISKNKIPEGEVRIFENKETLLQFITLEANDGQISILQKIPGATPGVNNDQTNNTNTKNNTTKKISIGLPKNKKTKQLISDYYEDGITPDSSDDGFNDLPSFFKFSFLEDANGDHEGHLKLLVKSKSPQGAVTGFNVFFMSKLNDFEDFSCHHLENLLSSFLPSFLSEVEESTFCIESTYAYIYDNKRLDGLKNGTIPHFAYDQVVATLEQAGFEYDKKTCMLASLGGSNGATPL